MDETDGKVIGIDMEPTIKKNRELLSKHVVYNQMITQTLSVTRGYWNCPIYHQQIINILEGVESITKEDVEVTPQGRNWRKLQNLSKQ